MQDKQLHVVFGAGQVGATLVHGLVASGHRVRVIQRSVPSAPLAGVEHVQADVYDKAAAIRAAAGADVVYQCTNAPYHAWPTQLPPLYRHIAAAAQTAGARLVVLDNLYMVGQTHAPFDETTPEHPCSKKGQVRKDLADELRAMHARGDLRVVFGRASDFFGPRVQQGAIQHPRAMAQLMAGKPVDLLGAADQLHSWSYVPDVAAGLQALGEHPETDGEVFHLPVLPPQTATAQLQALADALQVPLTTRVMPRWLLWAAGLVSPMMREMDEMLYQFTAPMVMRDDKIRARLGLQPTPLAVQAQATAVWLRQTSAK